MLDELSFRFTESHAVMQNQGQKTATSSSKRRHDWVMKLNRKRVDSTKNFSVCSGHSFQVRCGACCMANRGNFGQIFVFAVYMDRIRGAIRIMTKLSTYLKKS